MSSTRLLKSSATLFVPQQSVGRDSVLRMCPSLQRLKMFGSLILSFFGSIVHIRTSEPFDMFFAAPFWSNFLYIGRHFWCPRGRPFYWRSRSLFLGWSNSCLNNLAISSRIAAKKLINVNSGASNLPIPWMNRQAKSSICEDIFCCICLCETKLRTTPIGFLDALAGTEIGD